jgi:hypothetical protein
MTEQEPESGSKPQEIEDPEAYVNHRRLQSIFDARTKLRDRRITARTAGKSQEFRAVSAYRSAVSNYVMELEPLMQRFEAGTEPLRKKDFGDVTIEPNVRYREFHSGSNEWMLTKSNGDKVPIEAPPEAVSLPFIGLDCLFVYDDPLTPTWEIEHSRHGGRIIHQEVGQIPFSVLDDMVIAANRFLAEIGFELNPQEEDDPAHLSL